MYRLLLLLDVEQSSYSYANETIMIIQTLDEAVAGRASARNFRTTVSSKLISNAPRDRPTTCQANWHYFQFIMAALVVTCIQHPRGNNSPVFASRIFIALASLHSLYLKL